MTRQETERLEYNAEDEDHQVSTEQHRGHADVHGEPVVFVTTECSMDGDEENVGNGENDSCEENGQLNVIGDAASRTENETLWMG